MILRSCTNFKILNHKYSGNCAKLGCEPFFSEYFLRMWGKPVCVPSGLKCTVTHSVLIWGTFWSSFQEKESPLDAAPFTPQPYISQIYVLTVLLVLHVYKHRVSCSRQNKSVSYNSLNNSKSYHI